MAKKPARAQAAKVLLGPRTKKLKYWLEQNIDKPGEWTDLANDGHEVFHLIDPILGYMGKVLIDDYVYTYDDARKEFNLKYVN